MSNQYDELKNLLNVSRNMLGKNDLTESRKVLKRERTYQRTGSR